MIKRAKKLILNDKNLTIHKLLPTFTVNFYMRKNENI